MNSVVSGFQAAAASAATRLPVTERRASLAFNRSNQKRQIANQGSPKELLHQLEQMGNGKLTLNGLNRAYIRENLCYRFLVTETYAEAMSIENLLKSGKIEQYPKPYLNPI